LDKAGAAETAVVIEIVEAIERSGNGSKANLVATRKPAAASAHLPTMDAVVHW
jgi:hypothetical protein